LLRHREGIFVGVSDARKTASALVGFAWVSRNADSFTRGSKA
jgi:hypothetical protein